MYISLINEIFYLCRECYVTGGMCLSPCLSVGMFAKKTQKVGKVGMTHKQIIRFLRLSRLSSTTDFLSLHS